jgi:hypothetical protein
VSLPAEDRGFALIECSTQNRVDYLKAERLSRILLLRGNGPSADALQMERRSTDESRVIDVVRT